MPARSPSDSTTPRSATLPERPRMLIVGIGGLGGTLAGTLLEAGLETMGEVVALSRNTDVVDAVARRGFRLRGLDGARDVPGRVVGSLHEAPGPFDVIVLATQPPAVEDAAVRVAPTLAEHGLLVCLQNGLCEARVAKIVRPDQVVGAVVGWGASMPEAGIFERTSPGGFSLGRYAPDTTPDLRLPPLARMLEAVGPVDLTDNLAGARWSKLAINVAISALGTLAGERLGGLMTHRHVRRLALEMMTETVEVARAEGVTLEKVSGTLDLDWIALTPAERKAKAHPALMAKHSLLLAVGARFRRMRSSMLAAIERGRPPAVDFLNGEVVDRGRHHGIPTPYNAAARALVHEIAQGHRPSSMDTLRELHKRAEAIART